MTPNPEPAARLLSALDPHTAKFHFVTLPDGPEHLDSHRLFSSRFAVFGEVGAAIYVTASRTDGHGRKLENITGIRTAFADFDDGVPDRLPIAHRACRDIARQGASVAAARVG